MIMPQSLSDGIKQGKSRAEFQEIVKQYINSVSDRITHDKSIYDLFDKEELSELRNLTLEKFLEIFEKAHSGRIILQKRGNLSVILSKLGLEGADDDEE